MIKPTCFVMENVARAQKSNAYASARAIFKKAGYGLTEIVLDASLCGTPQKRKRFFCFGMLSKEDGFALNSLSSKQSKKAMTLRDYFGESLGFEFYYRHPRNYNRRAVFSIDEPAPTMRGVNRPVPKGYPGHPNDAAPITPDMHVLTINYNRRAVFSIDEPAPTMRGVNRPVPKGYPGHPNDAAPITPDMHVLTIEERGLIQTFPKTFQWVGNKTDVEQMIGNAVPVNLAKYVAQTVELTLKG